MGKKSSLVSFLISAFFLIVEMEKCWVHNARLPAQKLALIAPLTVTVFPILISIGNASS